MFVDKVEVTVVAGDGGDGKVSFRHEKFIDRGGPDGGDGGNGGSIFVVASNSENTLARFRHDKLVAAEAGSPGNERRKHGKKGEDMIVKVPVGTVVTRDGEVLADLIKVDQQVLIAKGGKGGFGNAHFVSSIRQAPRVAEKGEPGESFPAVFELKSIADVGIIGLPNSGKSTFLSVVSNAKPEIANYPFTTLIPNLGVADIDKNNSLLLADIPGLIKGASEGKGLGDEFLRHVERTKVLLHLIDAYEEDVAGVYKTITTELAAYSKELGKRPQLVVLTKIEGLDGEIVADQIAKLSSLLPKKTIVMAMSAQSGESVKEVLYELKKLVDASAKKTVKIAGVNDQIVIRPDFEADAWVVTKTDDGFIVTGQKIEKFAVKTRFDNDFSVGRILDIFKKVGILRELKRQGLKEGDRIQVGKNNIGSFEYYTTQH
jgi:GTP-binding protein